jgi:hypothetical protein
MKYSEALRNSINNLGLKVNMTLFGVSFYGPITNITTTIPTLPTDLAVANSNILLATFTVNNAGTGMTWDSSSAGSIARAAAETVSGTCLAAGYPRFARIHLITDTSGNALDTTKFRIQGTCGTTGTDFILDSTFYPMVLSTVYPLGNIVNTLGLGS